MYVAPRSLFHQRSRRLCAASTYVIVVYNHFVD